MIELRRPAAARFLVLAASLSLTCVCLYAAVKNDAIFLGVLAVLSGLAGLAVWRARAAAVRFDGETLMDDTGLVLCRMEDIKVVERGLAPLKPTSGFVIRTATTQPTGWSPGLWWRFGTRIGVGGATSARTGRNMANAIELIRSGALDELEEERR